MTAQTMAVILANSDTDLTDDNAVILKLMIGKFTWSEIRQHMDEAVALAHARRTAAPVKSLVRMLFAAGRRA